MIEGISTNTVIIGLAGGLATLGLIGLLLWWLLRERGKRAVAEAVEAQKERDTEKNKVANEKLEKSKKEVDRIADDPIDPADPWRSLR